MTVTTEERIVVHTGNGSTTVFPFTFLIPDADSLYVYTRPVGGTTKTLITSGLYTATGLGDAGGGSVTYPLSGSPLDSSTELIIERSITPTQGVSVSNQTRYYAEVAESVWDRLTMLAQELFEEVGRAAQAPEGSPGMLAIAGAANTAAIWNSDGDLVEGPTTSEIANAQTYALLAKTYADRLPTFTTRTEAEAVSADTASATYIIVAGLFYKYDAAGTALTTGDGRTWKPSGLVYPEHFGADTSAADNATAINAWLAYLGAGVIGAGTGTFDVQSAISTGEIDDLVILGHNLTLNYTGATTTGTLFQFGTSSATSTRVRIDGLRLSSDTTMTAGEGVVFERIARSNLENVTIDGQDGTGKFWHGIWIKNCDNFKWNGFDVQAQKDGIILSGTTGVGAAEYRLSNGRVLYCGEAGIHIAGGIGGFYFQGSSGTNKYNIKTSNERSAQQNRELFFLSGSVSDITQEFGYGIYIVDSTANANGLVQFDAPWIATGSSGNLFVGNFGFNGRVILNGGKIFNAGTSMFDLATKTIIPSTGQGDGIYSSNTSYKLEINGTTFEDNQGTAINQVAANASTKIRGVSFDGNGTDYTAHATPETYTDNGDLIINGISAPKVFDSRSEATNSATGQTGTKQNIKLKDIAFVYDASGTALTTGDSRTWSPDGKVTESHFGENTTPGTTDMATAINAALEWVGAQGGGTVYITEDCYFNSTLNLTGTSHNRDNVTLVIEEGVTFTQGADANPGIYAKDGTNCKVSGPGTYNGNYTEAGAWESLVTGLAITDGDGTGTSSAAYTAGTTATITVNALGTGYVKKGSRLTYITATVTYAYIVQADAAITAGTATVTLDRNIDADIASGQTIWINEWNRNAVIDSAYSAGATSITLRAPDVSSESGTPKMLDGDQFCFYGSYNDINQDPDYTEVYTVVGDVNWTGTYPNFTATVTITPALATDKVNGQMITSIMDHRNNRFSSLVFYGCTDSHVKDLKIVDSRLHGACFNGVITAPWDGVDPSTKPNNQCSITGCDDQLGAHGTAYVAAYGKRVSVFRNSASNYVAGANRNGATMEKTELGDISKNKFIDMYYGANINGDCTHININENLFYHCKIPVRQANTCRNVNVNSNQIVCDSSNSITAIQILAGPADTNDNSQNSTFIGYNQIVGSLSTANAKYGSAIQITPISLVASATEADWPHNVTLFENFIDGAGRYAVYALNGKNIRIIGTTALNIGYDGIYATDLEKSWIKDNYIQDCGLTAAADAFLFPDAQDNIISGNIGEIVSSANMNANVDPIAFGQKVSGLHRRINANQTITNNTTTKVVWNDTVYDHVGAIDGSGNIIVPDNMTAVRVTVNVVWASSSTGRRLITVKEATTNIGAINYTANSTSDHTFTTGWVKVTPGNEISVDVLQNSGGDLDLVSSLNRSSVFVEFK